MCLKYRQVGRSLDKERFLLRKEFVDRHVGFDLPDVMSPYRFNLLRIPCGKCSECLKAKQNDIAVRAFIEAKKKGSMHFVTLTYDDDNLPFAKRLYMVDKLTGELFSDSLATVIPKDQYSIDFRKELLDWFKGFPKGHKPFSVLLDLHQTVDLFNDLPFYDDNYVYYYNVTPSLNRLDVRLWLKRCRVNYKRHFNKALSDFTYIMVGEFGPNTCRPHYHICFFGASDDEVYWLASQWKKGFTLVEPVKVFNKDGSSGFLAAARYIAKYIYKGKFECSSVKKGDVEKPRYCTSIAFGVDLNDKLVSYYRCYDLFGKYDVNECVFYDKLNRFTLPTLKKLHEEVKKRARIDINGFSYKLPKNLLKRIWYVKNSKGVYEPSAVQLAFNSFICGDILDDFISKLKEDNPFMSDSEMDSEISRFKQSQVSSCLSKDSFAEQADKAFYSKSIF